jgi:excinuclease UvrABC nuclease subunit
MKKLFSYLSKNICRSHEINTDKHITKFYDAQCACMDDRCAHTLCIDYNKEIKQLSLSIYGTIRTHDYHNMAIIRVFKRIKGIIKLLLNGEIEASYEFLFDNAEAVSDYIKALDEGLNLVQKDSNI